MEDSEQGGPATDSSLRHDIKSVMAQEDCYTVEELPDESSDEEYVEAKEDHEEPLPERLKLQGYSVNTGNSARATNKALHLLDLPVDILTQIVDRITHTRDLLPLARTHTTLHRLTIPHIYSRFEIVWPPPSNGDDPEPDIDALTHGLTTLTFAEEVLNPNHKAPESTLPVLCSHCSQCTQPISPVRALPRRRRIQRGNYYAHFVRHFSLSNGPLEAVREYMLTRDNGKMLGTLVALAVARMPNLKTFIWDMPTGVSRDVFTALAALEEKAWPGECKLEKVWIRWHNKASPLYFEPKANTSSFNGNNSVTNTPPPPPLPPDEPTTVSSAGVSSAQSGSHTRQRSGEARVFEHPNHIELLRYPNLSLLPAVSSLTVLDIDEPAYLDEMNLLVAKSRRKLRKLRIGLAKHVNKEEWTQPSHHSEISISLDSSQGTSRNPSLKRWGGVLGTVFGQHAVTSVQHVSTEDLAERQSSHSRSTSSNSSADMSTPQTGVSQSGVAPKFKEELPSDEVRLFSEVLELQVIELERVSLSVFSLTKAIDWSKLTELTLFNCAKDEVLWKSLRKLLAPRNAEVAQKDNGRVQDERFWNQIRRPVLGTPAQQTADIGIPSDFPCKLKKIQTNRVSKALLNFLTHTLRPDSLEVLFLQEHGNGAKSEVTVEDICKGPVRRHRESLQKLMVISGTNETYEELPWASWIASREVISLLMNGKMTNLRELGIAISRKDWHFLLQRLPFTPELRSIYIPYMQHRMTDGGEDARQLAMHILDIVSLRPDIKLAYLGIFNHCYDIREGRPNEQDVRETTLAVVEDASEQAHDSADDDADASDDENDAGDEDNEGSQDELSHDDSSEIEESLSPLEDVDDQENLVGGPHFKLREIVWYERKVELFGARHARIRGWRASDKTKQESET